MLGQPWELHCFHSEIRSERSLAVIWKFLWEYIGTPLGSLAENLYFRIPAFPRTYRVEQVERNFGIVCVPIEVRIKLNREGSGREGIHFHYLYTDFYLWEKIDSKLAVLKDDVQCGCDYLRNLNLHLSTKNFF